MEKHLYVIIPAAGTGSRMNINESKLFLPIHGIPILTRTLLSFTFFSEKNKVNVHSIIVTSQELLSRVSALVEENMFDFVEGIILGGQTRQDSVYNGVQHLTRLSRQPKENDIVFIHDGARCLVDEPTLLRCFFDAEKYGACTAAVPVKDTIKEAASKENGELLVEKTLKRELLHAIQTPQAFTWDILQKSYQNAKETGVIGTDDTSLAEAMGYTVHLTAGSYKNIKITTPEDIYVAEAFLKEAPGEP